ncbi:MAG: N-acetylmuramoyl-L-alanine amidase [Bacteroidia bacterium]|nr:N-acetylmuramoyl-L-alanine amidase [Bacteroidia bacterium]
MRHIFLLVSLCCFVVSCQSLVIEDKPVSITEEREKLTLEYLKERYEIEQDEPFIKPRMIVLHWTVYETFEESFAAFEQPTLPNWRPDIENVSGLNVSAHFLVDQDGTIYRLMPETYMARHVIGLNHCAIGVENVGGTEKTPLTKAQLKSNIKLVQYLAKKYPIEYLIGHYEYTRFEDHPLWLEVDDGYRTEKTDPGPEFMRNVREATRSFNFKPVPNSEK